MAVPLATATATSALGTTVPSVGSYVVVFDDRVGAADAETGRLERAHGFSASDNYSAAVKGFAAVLTPPQVAALTNDPSVVRVVRDFEIVAAGKKPTSTGGEMLPTSIERIGTLDSAPGLGPASSAVAVLDTGLDLGNPDLNASPGVNCTKTAKSTQDDHGHGTHVAGTIAARQDGTGAVGVAPATRLYSVKVLDKQARGRLSGLLCGVDWVHANAQRLGIRVANVSITAAGYDDGACGARNGDILHAAICSSVRAGIVYVAAAGNSGTDLAATVPAAYSESLTATAMTDTDGTYGSHGGDACVAGESDDHAASYSNFATSDAAAAHILAAPGTCVVSTNLGGGVATMLGTSMAAPHVSGTAALCLGRPGSPGPCAGLDVPGVIDRLRGDAAARASDGLGFLGDPLSPVFGRRLGHLVSATGY